MRIDRFTTWVPQRKTLAACLAATLAVGSAAVLAAGHPGFVGRYGTAGLPLLPLFAATPVDAHAIARRTNPAPGLGDAAPRVRNRAPPRLPTRAPIRPAALVPVTNCNDAGSGSLREAATNAADGDVLDLHLLPCSTISLSSGAIETMATDVTLLGPGQGKLTIDGQHASYVLFGLGLSVTDLTIANGATANGVGGCISALGDLHLTRTTVTGCQTGDGSNVYSYGAGVDVRGDLTMVSSTISHSDSVAIKGSWGGGGYVGGDASVIDSTISHNTAQAADELARGGGLYVKGTAYLSHSRLTGNAVSSTDGTAYGGAVSASGAGSGGVWAINSTISGNTAHSDTKWSYGGGLNAGNYFDAAPGTIRMLDSTLSNNTASADCNACFIQGGGAHAAGIIQVITSTISGNTVRSFATSNGMARGGGLSTLASDDDGVIALYNSTLSGNFALGGEGGYGKGGGLATIQGNAFGGANVTMAFNQASTSGGGAIGGNNGSSPVFLSSILAENDAPIGADIASNAGPLTLLGGYNLIESADDDVTLPADTLDTDPALLPLANNGGPTATHALAACSPAIDAGDNGFGAYLSDQRGDPYGREYGGATDIGAFELQPDPESIFNDGFEPSPCP